MKNVVRDYVDRFLHERQARIRLIRILIILGLIVTMAVFWELRFTGIALTNETNCGKEEHTHTEECYEDVLICGQTESTGHVHTDACYDTQTVLICGQEESPYVPAVEGHTHTDSCYTTNTYTDLVCGQEEGEGHTHTDACYETVTETVLTCGQEESPYIPAVEGHTHTDACYETQTVLVCGYNEGDPDGGHVHTDSCYERQLVCGKEEHTHSVACMSDDTADVETASVWESTLPDHLTGIWADDLILVARSQLGYTESTENYTVTESGDKKGYTRYGAWYGDPYGDWCAMFVSFCLNYAGIGTDLMPRNSGCYAWTVDLSDSGMYAGSSDYTPKVGDIVFFDWTGDGRSNHVGIVEEVTYRTADGRTLSDEEAGEVYVDEYGRTVIDVDTEVEVEVELEVDPDEAEEAEIVEETDAADEDIEIEYFEEDAAEDAAEEDADEEDIVIEETEAEDAEDGDEEIAEDADEEIAVIDEEANDDIDADADIDEEDIAEENIAEKVAAQKAAVEEEVVEEDPAESEPMTETVIETRTETVEVYATSIKTIEGNASNMVKEKSYDAGNGNILGYGILPQQPEDQIEEAILESEAEEEVSDEETDDIEEAIDEETEESAIVEYSETPDVDEEADEENIDETENTYAGNYNITAGTFATGGFDRENEVAASADDIDTENEITTSAAGNIQPFDGTEGHEGDFNDSDYGDVTQDSNVENAWGKIVDSSGQTATVVTEGETYTFEIYFEFYGDVTPGHEYYLDVSEIDKYFDFASTGNIPTSEADAGEVMMNGTVIGYWFYDEERHYIVFTFNDEVVDQSDVWIDISISCTARSDVEDIPDDGHITIPLPGGNQEITWKRVASDLSIEKSTLSRDIDSETETGTYTYVVTVGNYSDGEVTLDQLTDVFNEYLSADNLADMDTITITHSDGTPATVLTKGTDYTIETNADGSFSIVFTNGGITLSPGDSFSITYTLDYDGSEANGEIFVENKITAEFEDNNGDKHERSDEEDDYRVVKRGTVDKSAVVDEDGTITWTIHVEAGTAGDLSGFTLTDEMINGDNQEFIDDSFQVSYTWVDESGQSHTGTLTGSQLAQMQQALLESGSADLSDYISVNGKLTSVDISYQTKDNGESGQYTVTNDVILWEDDEQIDEGKAEVGQGFEEGYVEKTHDEFDADAATGIIPVTWTSTITILPGGTLESYEDTLGWSDSNFSHKIIEDGLNLKVTIDGEEMSDSQYTVTVTETDGSTYQVGSFVVDFTFNITNDTDEPIVIVITYVTYVDMDTVDVNIDLNNTAQANFSKNTVIDKDDDYITKHGLISKSVSSYDTVTGTVEWKIEVNIYEILMSCFTGDKTSVEDLTNPELYDLSLLGDITVWDYIEGSTYISGSEGWSDNWPDWGGGDGGVTASGYLGDAEIEYNSDGEKTNWFYFDLTELIKYYVNVDYLNFINYVTTTEDQSYNVQQAHYGYLTFSTTVTNYEEYEEAKGEVDFLNHSELRYGDEIESTSDADIWVTPESELHKEGVQVGDTGYIRFTIDHISDLVNRYMGSGVEASDWEHEWLGVAFVDTYGGDLYYQQESFDFSYVTVDGDVGTVQAVEFETLEEYEAAIEAADAEIKQAKEEGTSHGSYIYYYVVPETHTIYFWMDIDTALTMESYSYTLGALVGTGALEEGESRDYSNDVYMEGFYETEAHTDGPGDIDTSGATGGYSGMNIRIVKKDSVDQTPLAGAEFTAYEATLGDDGKITYNETGDEVKGTTVNSGILNLTNLEYNKLYAIVETTVPEGYLKEGTETVYVYVFNKAESELTDEEKAKAEAMEEAGVQIYYAVQTVTFEVELAMSNTPDTSLYVNKQWLKPGGEVINNYQSDEVVNVELYYHLITENGASGNVSSLVNVILAASDYWGSGDVDVGYTYSGISTEDGIQITIQPADGSVVQYYYVYIKNGSSYTTYASVTPNTTPVTIYIPSYELTGDVVLVAGYGEGWGQYKANQYDVTVVAADSGSLTEPDGTNGYYGSYQLTSANGWSYEIEDLPRSTVINGTTYYYYYYFKEVTTGDEEWELDGYENNGGIQSGTVTITNKLRKDEDYVLPKAGGMGSGRFTLIGLLIIAAGAGGLLLRENRRRKRRVESEITSDKAQQEEGSTLSETQRAKRITLRKAQREGRMTLPKAHRRTLISLMMAAVLCVGMVMPITANASSVGSGGGKYTVTITESSYGEQYTAYKIFDLTYSQSDSSAVAYTIDTNTADGAAWYSYLMSAGLTTHPFTFDEINTSGVYRVAWDEDYEMSGEDSNKYLASFFKVAAKAIEGGSLSVSKSVVNPYNIGTDDPYTATAMSTRTTYPGVESSTLYAAQLTFSEPGYYLVISTLGNAVVVDSTNGTAITIAEKNDIPSLEKEETVWDENLQDWVTKDSVNVGDILEFEVFIEHVDGQTKLELHDHMSSGLFLEYDDQVSVDDVDIHTVRVYYGDAPDGTIYGDGSIYNKEDIDWTLMHPGNEYEIVINAWDEETQDNDAFELIFDEDFLQSDILNENTVFRVVYYAEVTGSEFNEEYQDVENNYAFVSYGMFGRTDFVYTYAESYGFDLQKADGEWLIGGQQFEDGYESHLLAGAEFELYHAEVVYDDENDPLHDDPEYVAGEQVRFIHTNDPVIDTEGTEHPSDSFRVADEEDAEEDITTTIVIEDGEVSIYGIAAGNYILRETKAPEGYVLPDKDILIQIVEEDIWVDDAEVTVIEHIYVDGVEITDEEHSKVVISNTAGDILVETGGIGTTVFTVTGLAIIAGAAGLMYIKRRRRVRT